MENFYGMGGGNHTYRDVIVLDENNFNYIHRQDNPCINEIRIDAYSKGSHDLVNANFCNLLGLKKITIDGFADLGIVNLSISDCPELNEINFLGYSMQLIGTKIENCPRLSKVNAYSYWLSKNKTKIKKCLGKVKILKKPYNDFS